MGWASIARLGLVQTALGAIVVLMTSTINRVMVVELMLPALVPGLLVATHYAVQIMRPAWGYGSDIGGRRTPWIVGGMAALALGARRRRARNGSRLGVEAARDCVVGAVISARRRRRRGGGHLCSGDAGYERRAAAARGGGFRRVDDDDSGLCDFGASRRPFPRSLLERAPYRSDCDSERDRISRRDPGCLGR